MSGIIWLASWPTKGEFQGVYDYAARNHAAIRGFIKYLLAFEQGDEKKVVLNDVEDPAGRGTSEPRIIERQKMHLLTTFFRKPLADQVLYLEAAFWLGISRLAMLIVPFRWIAPFLGTHMARSDADKNGDRETVISVSRAILTMSRHLPWECKCLAQAISGKMMIRRRQIPSTLYLGVAKKEDGDLKAHAWLRTGDIIILGGGGLERFAVVSTFA